MLKSVKIQSRQSEIRQRLADLMGLEKRSKEETEEIEREEEHNNQSESQTQVNPPMHLADGDIMNLPPAELKEGELKEHFITRMRERFPGGLLPPPQGPHQARVAPRRVPGVPPDRPHPQPRGGAGRHCQALAPGSLGAPADR